MISSFPLAFIGFANLALLAGFAGASIPIIIHLLNRRKFREMKWAAMQFLLAAIRKNARRIRLEQWLLLAIRTLLIVLLVTAMLKPYLESVGALPVIAGRRTHRVVVLDGSLSMSSTPEGEPARFDQAKTLAGKLLEKNARRGDVISILLMGDPPRPVIRAPSSNHAEAMRELAETQQTHGGADLTASFKLIEQSLGASDIPQKEIVILTDLQSATWKEGENDRGESALKRSLQTLDRYKPRSIIIDLGKSGEKNTAITDIALEQPIVTIGKPAPLRVTLKGYGETERTVTVRLMLDGRYGPQETATVAAGRDVTLDFAPVFSSPGDHLAEAVIEPADRMPLDDHRRISIPVREHVKVLLVDGDFKPEPYKAETDLLSAALEPDGDSDDSPSIVAVETVSEAQFDSSELGTYDVIALCNVARVSETEVAALESFLASGGGVLIFGGDQVEPDNYNEYLFKNGKGILPAKLGPSVGAADSRETVFTFNPLEFKHPIVRQFSGTRDEVMVGLTNVITRQYHKLLIPPDTSARTALAFSSGDPAVVEGKWKRGTVFLIATSADLGWTGWPIHYSYPAVMEEMVLQAAGGRLAERNVAVGRPLDQLFPASAAGAPVTIVPPDNKPAETKITAAGDGGRLHYEQTDLSGVYRARVGPPINEESTFAANPPPAESDPAKLDRTALGDLLSGWNFAYYTNIQELISNPASVSQRGELHRPLLAAVLALLFIESILAWRFGHHAAPTRSRAART